MLRKVQQLFSRSGFDPSEPPPPDRIKLVAIDIDGTLLRSDQKMTRRVATSIQKTVERGVRVMMVTARGPTSAVQICKLLPVDSVFICFNGAVICDGTDDNVIYHKAMEPAFAREVIHLCREVQPNLRLRVDVKEKWYTDRHDKKGDKITADKIGPIDEIVTEPVTRVTFLGPGHIITRAREAVQNAYEDEVDIPLTDERILQIAHRDAQKAIALEWVGNRDGITGEEAVAIGNAPNDMSMFKWARWAVAVENAREYPDVVDAAHAMVADNNHDGVAEAIEKFVLEPEKKSKGLGARLFRRRS
ncbi:MAG: Cof-type HAD-IIB family hydrolase [Phycisphaeraceae bacterium]|nr:Cof-type HAD-IIB family hydrolase [Phycisphaeraceae bacterium]